MSSSASYRYVVALAVGLVAACKQEAVNTLPSCDSVEVTTLAGNGTMCETPQGQTGCFANGSGGPNGTAEFNYPFGVAVDSQDNVYVADLRNNSIRRIDTSGNVTTVAGQDEPEGEQWAQCNFSGVGPNWVCEPGWVAVDNADNVYFETVNGSLLELALSGAWAIALSPTEAPLNAIAFDSDDNMYWSSGTEIEKMDATGTISVYAGSEDLPGYVDGPGTVAEFGGPLAVTVDSKGNLYVLDIDSNDSLGARIRRVDPHQYVSTLAGNNTGGYLDGPGPDAEFFYPQGIASDTSGNIYVADSYNNRIRKIAPDGTVSTLAGSGPAGQPVSADVGAFLDGTAGPNGTARFNQPLGVAVDRHGNVYVADTLNNRIRFIPACR